MSHPLLCRAIHDDSGKIKFESVESGKLTLKKTIEDDKRYGIMKPANGKYFTYKVLNEDVEFTAKQARKAMQYAQKKWRLYGDLPKFKRAKPGEVIDFRLVFRTVETDPDKQLTLHTIMYHYFPINDINNKFRGLCVVNKKFFYTGSGDAVKGEEFIRHGIQVQFPNGLYETIDFDVTYGHELGHGLGLPHDSDSNSMMSTPYDDISEMPSPRDQARISAPSKYGIRKITSWHLFRWIAWLNVASDR